MDPDTAIRELYRVRGDISDLLVNIVAVKPTEPWLRDRLVAYEGVLEETYGSLESAIRVKMYHRARHSLLRLIRVVLALRQEVMIYQAILRGGR